jgi:hypothetical protein
MDATRVEDFFAAYGADLATGEGERIVANYDAQALLLSDQAGRAVTNGAEFANYFSAASAAYLERGFGEPRPTVTRVEEVTPDVVLAWVTWHYRSIQDKALFDADYLYALRTENDVARIAVVLSINEAERAAAYVASESSSAAS